MITEKISIEEACELAINEIISMPIEKLIQEVRERENTPLAITVKELSVFSNRWVEYVFHNSYSYSDTLASYASVNDNSYHEIVEPELSVLIAA